MSIKAHDKFKSEMKKEINQLEEEIKFLENCPLLYTDKLEKEIQELISQYNEKIMFLKDFI